jgi:hypothetical protein
VHPEGFKMGVANQEGPNFVHRHTPHLNPILHHSNMSLGLLSETHCFCNRISD